MLAHLSVLGLLHPKARRIKRYGAQLLAGAEQAIPQANCAPGSAPLPSSGLAMSTKTRTPQRLRGPVEMRNDSSSSPDQLTSTEHRGI